MSVHSVINRWAKVPFSYGADCCQFAGEVIQEITGRNPMDQIAEYGSEREADAVIQSYGGLRAAVTATLGEPIAVAQARDGDPLLVDLRTFHPRMADLIGDEMIGVYWKSRIVVRTTRGITDWPTAWAICAWRAD